MLYPKESNITSLTALNDGKLETCTDVILTSGETLLKASIDPTYDTLNVSIMVSGTDVIFGPNSDPIKCHTATSLLMTHDSNKDNADEHMWNCNPFCAAPGTCLLRGNEVVGAINNWSFACACPRRSCNELFLTMRSGSPEVQVSVCEIIPRRE